MEQRYISVLPVELELTELKEVGILPFITRPEVIVWENRVFIPTADNKNVRRYIETSFAVIPSELVPEHEDNPLIHLKVRSGELVQRVHLPNSDALPGVVRWGDRIFRKEEDAYIEAFFTIAYELADIE